MPNSALAKLSRLRPFELLLPQDQILRRVSEMGAEISRDYAGTVPVLVGVLKGCIMFMADLMKAIKLPVEVEFVAPASYRHGVRGEDDLVLMGEFSSRLHGRQVLIVEGIVDSGRTVTLLVNRLRKLEPASIEVVTLLDKPGSHRVKVDVKYRGFAVGNDFVIGYGLDNTQQYRNLPFVGRLKER